MKFGLALRSLALSSQFSVPSSQFSVPSSLRWVSAARSLSVFGASGGGFSFFSSLLPKGTPPGSLSIRIMGLAKNSRQSIEPQVVAGQVFKHMDLAVCLGRPGSSSRKVWKRTRTHAGPPTPSNGQRTMRRSHSAISIVTGSVKGDGVGSRDLNFGLRFPGAEGAGLLSVAPPGRDNGYLVPARGFILTHSPQILFLHTLCIRPIYFFSAAMAMDSACCASWSRCKPL